MPVRRFDPITVVGRPVRTFIEVRRGDFVEIRATGTVNFGGAVLGIGAPVLGPDGDNWPTPPDYPAPSLHKNSLIVGIRSATYPYPTLWHQGGTNRSFSCPVDGFLSLAANDGLPDDNTGGWSVSLTITTPERFGTSVVRLGIDRTEFVQAIQRADNSVPLISGKQTLVRVFVRSGRSDTTPVAIGGSIAATYADGFNVSRSASGTAIPEGTHDRNNLASSLNFILPVRRSPGTARFFIRVFVPGRETEVGGVVAVNTEAEFIREPGITINPALVALPAIGFGPPSLIAAQRVLNAALQRLPMDQGLRVLPWTTASYPLPFGDAASWRNLMYNVGTVLPRPNIGLPGERDFMHVAFVVLPPGTAAGGIAMYSPFISTITAICGISRDPVGNFDFDVETCVHEIGHALGLNHAACGDPPIPMSGRLPRFTEEPGWFAAGNRMVRAGVPEMMTYCGPRWPSITAYRYILNGRHD